MPEKSEDVHGGQLFPAPGRKLSRGFGKHIRHKPKNKGPGSPDKTLPSVDGRCNLGIRSQENREQYLTNNCHTRSSLQHKHRRFALSIQVEYFPNSAQSMLNRHVRASSFSERGGGFGLCVQPRTRGDEKRGHEEVS